VDSNYELNTVMNLRKIVPQLIGTVVAPTATSGIAAAQGGMGDQMGGGMYGGWWLLWAIFLIAILALAYAVVTRTTDQSSAPETDTALETLRERYARGEISEEEFEESRERLKRDKTRR
jgi:putative membrane protein